MGGRGKQRVRKTTVTTKPESKPAVKPQFETEIKIDETIKKLDK